VQSLDVAWATVVFFGLAFGAYETIFFALSMGVTESTIRASMYAILMAVSNIGTAVGMAVAGALVDAPNLGYRGALLTFSVANVLVMASLPLVFGRRKAVVAEPA